MGKKEGKYDLIIIGGGPAGLIAGLYAVRKGLQTLILAKDFLGQVGRTALVENWPGIKKITGTELIFKFKEQLEEWKPRISGDEMVILLEKDGDDFLVITNKKNIFKSKAVIIATGRNPRPLKIPGEKEYIGKGVSYCSTCDGPLFTDKRIAVIGGGNAAFETAIEMAERCPQVYLLSRSQKIIADQVFQKRVADLNNIEVLLTVEPRKIKGGNFVDSLIYFDKKSGKEKELKIEGVFIEIGSVPAANFAKELVEYNNQGEIIINHHNGATKTTGLFAAGDVTDIPYKQIIIAAGEGAKAALTAYNYLTRNEY